MKPPARALEAALWRRLSTIVGGSGGDCFQDEAWNCADAIVAGGDVTPPFGKVDSRIAALTTTRSDLHIVSDACPPATVELSTEPTDLEKEMRSVMVGIADDDTFWERDPEGRQWTMALHDSLSALRDDLGAEAVA